MLLSSIITATGLLDFVKFPEKLFPRVPVSRPIPTSEQIPAFTPSPFFEQIPPFTQSPSFEPIRAFTPSPFFEEIPAFTPSPFFEEIPAFTPRPSFEQMPAVELILASEEVTAATPVPASKQIQAIELITVFTPATFFTPIPVIELLSASEEVPVEVLDTTNKTEPEPTWWSLPEDEQNFWPKFVPYIIFIFLILLVMQQCLRQCWHGEYEREQDRTQLPRYLQEGESIIRQLQEDKCAGRSSCSVKDSDGFHGEFDEGRRRTMCSNPGRGAFIEDGGGQMGFGAYGTDGR
jgi:hypothetical protein